MPCCPLDRASNEVIQAIRCEAAPECLPEQGKDGARPLHYACPTRNAASHCKVPCHRVSARPAGTGRHQRVLAAAATPSALVRSRWWSSSWTLRRRPFVGPTPGGWLPLHRAAASSIYAEMALPRSDPNGSTLLGNVVPLLLRHYPHALQTRDNTVYLPMHLAAKRGASKVTRILARANHGRALRCPTTTERQLPFHVACCRNTYSPEDTDNIREIADLCPRTLQRRDKDGHLPLHYTTMWAPPGVAEMLAVRGSPAENGRHLGGAAACIWPSRFGMGPSSDAFVVMLPPGVRERDAKGRLSFH